MWLTQQLMLRQQMEQQAALAFLFQYITVSRSMSQ